MFTKSFFIIEIYIRKFEATSTWYKTPASDSARILWLTMKTEMAGPADRGKSWGAITHCTPFQNLSYTQPLTPVTQMDVSDILVREILFLRGRTISELSSTPPSPSFFELSFCLVFTSSKCPSLFAPFWSIEPAFVQLSLTQDTRSYGSSTSIQLFVSSLNSQNRSVFCSNC